MRNAIPRRRRGFTLIEILVALAIVAIGLAAAVRATSQVIAGTESARLRLAVLGGLSFVAAALTIAAPAGAGPLDACAQRVIRDWYSGGRIDRMYPLGCYRAAIRALPEDVLQYSDADKDIARALAYAQRGRRDPGNGPPASSAGPPRCAASRSWSRKSTRSRKPKPQDRPR